ncbi:MAG: lipid-A-disaccharide synthase [Bacteroidetes bacterium]|nr:lipid-A-disaccharide synthase [Bacteroidota bacterium]
MKYYLIAGEASGDLHGSNLMKQIAAIDKNANFRFWGGDKMSVIGGKPVKHIKELAFMGFLEVLLNIRTILRNFSICKNDIIQYKPDVLILIDYPGFNLRMAKFAKENGIKVIYYISPQIWAWKQSRVHKIKNCVDKMLVILPFEKDFYAKFDFNADFVGHPLLDALNNDFFETNKNDFIKINILNNKPIVAILPGSRKQEITKMLKIMTETASKFADYQFVVAGMSSQPIELYQRFLIDSEIKIIFDKTYELLKHSEAAIVVSGTATLETALIGTPQVVCYKGGKLSYHIAKKLVKINYISLVNLIMDKHVVKELIQNDFNNKNLTTELSELLNNKEYRNTIIDEYKILKQKLGGIGASQKAAEIIKNFLTTHE